MIWAVIGLSIYGVVVSVLLFCALVGRAGKVNDLVMEIRQIEAERKSLDVRIERLKGFVYQVRTRFAYVFNIISEEMGDDCTEL